MMNTNKATKFMLALFGTWFVILLAYALGVAWFLNRVLNIVEKAVGR